MILLIVVIAIGIISVVLFSTDNTPFIDYRSFHQELENDNIQSVIIEDDRIRFEKKDEEITYYTDNPNSDRLKEELLLSGVSVNESSDVERFNLIFDMLFYLFFFGAVALGVYKLTEINRTTFKVVKRTNVSFHDIAGMEEVKKEMMHIVSLLKNPTTSTRPIKGIILEGPPGNGKTLFAKALANEAHVNFIATKGADFQSAMMSMGAHKIKMVFKKAARHKPCIIFIDEFDGIGERRNYAGTGVDKENNRIIVAMLNEMDGFRPNDGILVIAATNSYMSLDAALVRPGRFDLKYHIPNPDFDTRLELIKLYTANKTMSKEIDFSKLANSFENLSCSAIEAILNEAEILSKLEAKEEITLQNVIDAAYKTASKIDIKKLK